jgi:predicted amidohydrolase
MKIRLAQIYPTLGNLNKNTELVKNEIQKALQEKSEVIVFPELALTGYFLKDQVVDLTSETAEKLEEIKKLSTTIDIVIGAIEESPDHMFYNTAFYFSQGELLHSHRKAYLPTYGMFDEKRYFSAGNTIQKFSTKFGNSAMLICEDAWHVSSIYLAALDGATTLYILSSSPYREDIPAYWQSLNQFYAEKFALNIIYCNRVGVEDGVTFWGGSEAYTANGTLIQRAPLFDQAALEITVDHSVARSSRIASPLFKDERPDLVLKELKRIWHER